MVSIFDLQDLYKTYFNRSPYFITPKDSEKPVTQDIVYAGITQNPNPKGTIYRGIKHHQPFNKIGAHIKWKFKNNHIAPFWLRPLGHPGFTEGKSNPIGQLIHKNMIMNL